MSEEMTKAMRKAISDVMNKMFLLPVQIKGNGIALNKWFSNHQALVGAILNFTGPSSGFSFLLMPKAVIREITANFLGVSEKAVDVQQERDTVKEALNMIAGLMFSQFDTEGAFQIGIPELLNESELMAGKLDGFNTGAILIETEHSLFAAGTVISQA